MRLVTALLLCVAMVVVRAQDEYADQVVTGEEQSEGGLDPLDAYYAIQFHDYSNSTLAQEVPQDGYDPSAVADPVSDAATTQQSTESGENAEEDAPALTAGALGGISAGCAVVVALVAVGVRAMKRRAANAPAKTLLGATAAASRAPEMRSTTVLITEDVDLGLEAPATLRAN
jgi:hypothetical protein